MLRNTVRILLGFFGLALVSILLWAFVLGDFPASEDMKQASMARALPSPPKPTVSAPAPSAPASAPQSKNGGSATAAPTKRQPKKASPVRKAAKKQTQSAAKSASSGGGLIQIPSASKSADKVAKPQIGGLQSAMSLSLGGNDGYPVFPDNPPKASATEVIPNAFFLKDTDLPPTLQHVSNKIHAALDEGGYFDTSFYQFRNGGFALATKLEKINEDGSPVVGAERWTAVAGPRFDMTFTEYLKNLFISEPGYYRIIVFIVSAEAFNQSPDEVEQETAEAWVAAGANALHKDIAKAEYTDDHRCTALVYVFEKSKTAPSKFAGSWLQGRTHLEKSKLWSALSQ